MVEDNVRLDTEPVVAEKLPIEPVVAEEQQAERAEDSPQLDVVEEPTLEPEPPRNPNAKWYILQAHTGYEGRVEQTIREKLRIKGLGELVDEIFIPSEEIVRTKGGKQRRINQKYFPGYILIRMELKPELWHLLNDIDRISGFVGGTQRDPLPMDEEELSGIKAQVNEGFQQKAAEEEYVIDQRVTITEGPFNGFTGIIGEINTEREKLKVLVSIFGRPTPVEVEFDKVKNVEE
ncbi:MAG TPA: transcription termination/antitermination protein NusG [Deltaproteobacteria bacterium]|nr:transcription termination/antitermination protein NusG [Deltaproteobacteria bacterium]